MKNIFTLFTLAFIFAVIFTSCKKETITNTVYIKDTTITNTTTVKDTVYAGSNIVGFWPGTYGSPGNYPTFQFSFLFRSDNTVRIYADGTDTTSPGEIGTGVYSIIGYSVTTQFNLSGNVYSTYGTVDSSFISYQGTIGQGLNTSGFLIDIAHKQ
jgi:hypothetical protein